jgi:hypothetical protein
MPGWCQPGIDAISCDLLIWPATNVLAKRLGRAATAGAIVLLLIQIFYIIFIRIRQLWNYVLSGTSCVRDEAGMRPSADL